MNKKYIIVILQEKKKFYDMQQSLEADRVVDNKLHEVW